MKEKRSSLGVKHRHKTESQSATDFLMTYAMAILIIVIVMALLIKTANFVTCEVVFVINIISTQFTLF